jgi:predicted alpha/beta hydrolase family esterase
MKNAIIVHGMPSRDEYYNPANPKQSEDHWLQWLTRELNARGIVTNALDFPKPYAPVYGTWKEVFERHPITTDTLLIGHSLGAGFLVRWLSENKTHVGKVALVAPFLDLNHNKVGPDFFDFKIDGDMGARTKGMAIFIAPEDDKEILESAVMITAHVPTAETMSLVGRGYFTLDVMKTEAFPELLDFLLK